MSFRRRTNRHDAWDWNLRRLLQCVAVRLQLHLDVAARRLRELEQNQTGRLVEILARFETVPGGGQCHAMRGLLEEAEEVLRLESGVYPARLEPRLLAVSRKLATCELPP